MGQSTPRTASKHVYCFSFLVEKFQELVLFVCVVCV